MSGRWRRARDDEEGSSAIEMVILFPVTLLIVLLIIQFGVWYHAADIARAAAQQGVKTASAYGATAGAGQAQANAVLDDNGRSLIRGTTVTPFRDAALARMTVAGTALTVVPILHLPIHETATAPVEAFRPPPGP
ncbi:MAG: pilus assembly protein [Actinomycetota bacterium]|nr:pilus assembly protein [Actinomycetota bacterium]